MKADDCIRTRRSVRDFSAEPVSDTVIEGLVELARHAPSWANSQCVRFHVVRQPALKEELAAILSGKNPARKAILAAPVVVVFVAKAGLAGYKKGDPVDDRVWHMFDTGLAVQTFCLAAHQAGLGTVIVGYFDHRKAAEILNLPEGFEVVALTPLGIPVKIPKEPRRLAVEALIFRERLESP
ncbi:MAG: nitroreductase family protein [Planctomycetota bacterium]